MSRMKDTTYLKQLLDNRSTGKKETWMAIKELIG